MLPPPPTKPHALLQSCNTFVRHHSPRIPSSEPVTRGSPHGHLLSWLVGQFLRGNCSLKGNSSAWLSPSRELWLPLRLPPLFPLNSLIHSNPHRIQFRAVGTYHLFLLLSPHSRLLSGTILPCTFILVVRRVKANSLALLLQQIWCKMTEKTSTMQKSLKWLCLVNNVIALAASFKEMIALLLSPQARQGLRDYFFPIPVFQ